MGAAWRGRAGVRLRGGGDAVSAEKVVNGRTHRRVHLSLLIHMTRLHRTIPLASAFVTASVGAQQTATSTKFTARDVFNLEWVSDPQIAPDGRRVIFGRTGYDIMKDVKR